VPYRGGQCRHHHGTAGSPEGQHRRPRLRDEAEPLLKGRQVLGTDYGTLGTHGFTAGRTVDAPCGNGDSGQGYELALELTVPPGTNAGTTGWEIDYRIGGHTASTTFPEGAILCSTSTIDAESCKHVWQQYGVSW
jgi:hypothetical protein